MFDDLRDYLQALDERGWIKKVEGADWNLEIGAIHELMAESFGPALLFDMIKGYPKGYRIATNLNGSKLAQRIAYDFPEELSDVEIVKYWVDKWINLKPIPPVEVESGPITENVITGKDIDIFKFPVPKWHELDGGRYIGTGIVSINRDPEEGWINGGTYRVMCQDDDKKVVSYYVSTGKHGDRIRKKYWAKGESCPVAMVFGQGPALYLPAYTELAWGVPELDMAGALTGEPIEIIRGRVTGLPIPARAEIAIEGFAPPPSEDSRPEGPFGEWTGYYGSGRKNEPVLHIETVYHRNNPILQGHPPIKPPVDIYWPIPTQSSSVIWQRLITAGFGGIVKAVYGHGAAGVPICVISIKQSAPGQAKEIASIARSFQQGNLRAKFIIVVDDDIDISNWDEVTWAVYTRCLPETGIEITGGHRSSRLYPALSPEKRAIGDITEAKVFIDACRPFHWKDQFPPVNKCSDKLRKEIADKWKHVFESGG
jgi:4-hydroxy-3-polyprenylbenzoate decarboxylase